jgi:catechol 2,3-dioxygenase-like lactoylglutathione lyase family enzyme
MPEVLSSTFVLAVRDLAASVRFYVDKLDFIEDFRVDGWAFLSRGACRLRLGHCPGVIPMSHAPDHSWFAYLHVRDAACLYRDCVARGVEVWHPLADKPWGMREFAIVTPDGHRIVFGETVPDAEPYAGSDGGYRPAELRIQCRDLLIAVVIRSSQPTFVCLQVDLGQKPLVAMGKLDSP